MMKKLLTIMIAITATVFSANAQYNLGTISSSDLFGTPVINTVNNNSIYVDGYFKSDGSYVNGHYRSTPNKTNHDNYSTFGNMNPYTGNTGSRAKDYSVGAYNYGSGHTIHTGSRGGQYYINSNGNKTYVPKRR